MTDINETLRVDISSQCDDDYTRSLEFLSKVFLECPDTQDKLVITSTKGSESGKESLEIVTEGKESKWLFRVSCEEVT